MDTNKEIHINNYRVLAEFRYQIRRFIAFTEQKARAIGLEPQQHQLLLALKGLPEEKKATIGNLAERLQIQHHSAVELIDRLVEHGLVERMRDEEDHRRVLVRLTAAGDEILEKITHLTLAELHTTAPSLVEALSILLNDM